MKRTIALHAEAQARVDAESNQTLVDLLAMGPAEIATWLDANVKTIAQARNVLLMLIIAIRAMK